MGFPTLILDQRSKRSNPRSPTLILEPRSRKSNPRFPTLTSVPKSRKSNPRFLMLISVQSRQSLAKNRRKVVEKVLNGTRLFKNEKKRAIINQTRAVILENQFFFVKNVFFYKTVLEDTK